MLVLIAKNIKPALRGKLKLWFIEVAPYIFVSSVKDSCAQKVTEYIWQYCDIESQILVIKDSSHPPFYKVTERSFKKGEFLDISGISLKCYHNK